MSDTKLTDTELMGVKMIKPKNIDTRMTANILVVEDDRDLSEALVETLSLAGFKPIVAHTGTQALARLAQHPFGLVLTDVNMPEMDGTELLARICREYPQLPVLMMTAYGNVEKAVAAIKRGAVDYLAKPFQGQALLDKVHQYFLDAGVQTSTAQSHTQPVSEDPQSIRLFQLADRVAQTDSSVLIAGESGTGKEVLASYIHARSPRAKQPFIAINCAAIPETMLEATLFGHEKGAFTGAHQSAPGKFEQANGGTILLDEISEMDLALQAKLLRVLQEREVERVGGKKVIPLDVRVIATTNRDLMQTVAQGKFREDLYYRLNVFPLAWLPLRERPLDIVPIAESLLAKHSQRQCQGKGKSVAGRCFDEAAKAKLRHYHWPGNVRELDNVIQRALILSTSAVISADCLLVEPDVAQGRATAGTPPSYLDSSLVASTAPSNPAAPAPSNPASPSIPAAVEPTEVAFEWTKQDLSRAAAESGSVDVIEALPENRAAPPSEMAAAPASSLGEDLQVREFQLIIDTLRRVNGSRKTAAEMLGISPRTLRYKMARMRDNGFNVDAALSS